MTLPRDFGKSGYMLRLAATTTCDAAVKRPRMVTATITIPPSLLIALDAEAQHQDRSRSWLAVEAIRVYLERRADSQCPSGRPEQTMAS